jgi:chemotaxis protein MotB
MSRVSTHLNKLLLVSLLALATGCAEKDTGMNEQDQAAQAAADEVRNLQGQLDQAIRDRMAAQDEADRLRRANQDLQNQFASAPEPAPGWSSVPGGAMIEIEGTVLFDSGKAELRSGGKATLNEVARAVLNQFAASDIYIFGHTDNEPIQVSDWDDNYELSSQRALSVLRYLRSQGVPQNMCAGGWGQDRPVADNASAESKQRNRRVQIFAMEQTAMPGAARASAR